MSPQKLAAAEQNVLRDQSAAASRNVAAMLSTRIAGILAPAPGAAPQSVSAVELAGEKTIALYSGKRGTIGKCDASDRGLSADDGARSLGVWLNGATSIISSTRDNESYNGSTWSTLLGFDFKPIERLVFGVVGGFEYNYTMPYFIRETTGRYTYGFFVGP